MTAAAGAEARRPPAGDDERRPDRVLLESVHGHVLLLTINRPAARNAVTREVSELIAAALDRLDADPSLRVGVITGAGGTFCAGMDLKDFAAGRRPSLPGRGFAGFVEAPPSKPLVAAVEGYALAGGLEIVLACDVVVAGENASFGIPEVRRGLVAAGGGLLRLPEKIPANIAAELALTGATIPARRAHEIGLVNRVCADGETIATALDLAAAIGANAPLALAAAKQILRESCDWPVAERFDRQRVISEPVFASDDAAEGARAFAERRAPNWKGR